MTGKQFDINIHQAFSSAFLAAEEIHSLEFARQMGIPEVDYMTRAEQWLESAQKYLAAYRAISCSNRGV